MLTIQELGDLELAVLLSLVAQQHCIITTDTTFLPKLAQELRLIATRVFPLSCVLVDCSASTTLDHFRQAVLLDLPSTSALTSSHRDLSIADVVITKDLNLASHNVQTQALELIRTRRLPSHTVDHAVSADFLFISLQSSDSVSLTRHLNDLFAISHYHLPDDGFPNLEEAKLDHDSVSPTSALSHQAHDDLPHVSHADIDHLRSSAAHVRLTADVSAYLHNVTVFLRLSRYVAGGVSALATSHLRSVAKALAPLHSLTYCPPSLVALAAKKVYPHRIVVATAKNEPSLQWGSDAKVVREILHGFTAEAAIDDVLASVEAPL